MERVKTVMNYRRPVFWIVVAAVIVCAVLAVCLMIRPAEEVELGDIESVTVDGSGVSYQAAEELVSLIRSSRGTPFIVGLDDPNSLSRSIELSCANGDLYVLHYQYRGEYPPDPRQAGEDDYRSILTFYPAGKGGQKAWKMEHDFDAELEEWLSGYAG